MKTIQLLSAVLVMSMLTACAGGGGSDSKDSAKAQSVDANGYCTADYLTLYNDVAIAFVQLQTLLNGIPNEQLVLNQMKATNAACKRLFPKYADVTCKAELQNQVQEIGSGIYKEGCQMLKEGMARHGL
ncbi:hypothetical protein ACNQKP_05915 [Bdellovibrio bacteriovorus]|uniref:hypothetical protein n=1 Tax=Bdellovibrio bacteriovorus TaxID=959 RepID=UPI003AA81BBF